MSNLLPLYPGAEPCVNSGFCCRMAACPFGQWNEEKHSCEFLTEDNKCGKFDRIVALPKEYWEASPAFGAGCSSTLFNEARDRIIRENPAMYALVNAARSIQSTDH